MKLGPAPWESVLPRTSFDASIRRQARSPLATSRWFRHQRYEDEPRTSPSPLRAASPHCVDDDAQRATLNAAAARMRAAGVRCVYLVARHVRRRRPDRLGLRLGRVSPTAADGLRRASKSLVDRIVGDRRELYPRVCRRLRAGAESERRRAAHRGANLQLVGRQSSPGPRRRRCSASRRTDADSRRRRHRAFCSGAIATAATCWRCCRTC